MHDGSRCAGARLIENQLSVGRSMQNLRYAFRMLRKQQLITGAARVTEPINARHSPGLSAARQGFWFAVAAILALTPGIGRDSANFSQWFCHPPA